MSFVFNAAAIAATRQVVVDAPVDLPPVLTAMLDETPQFQAQFRNAAVDFDPSPHIAPPVVLRNLDVVRTRMGRVQDMVGIHVEKTRPQLLNNMVWIIPDTRGVAANPATDPHAVRVDLLASMVIYSVRAVKITAAAPLANDNIIWQASLICSTLSNERAAVVAPDRALVTFDQLLQGFVAFSAFKPVFDAIVWPDGAKFFEATTQGCPIAPETARASAVATSAAVSFVGIDMDPEYEAQKALQAGQIKNHTRDADQLARYRGTFSSDVLFEALFGQRFPVFQVGVRAGLIAAKRAVPEFQATELQIERMLKFQFGSADGKTATGHVSMTVAARTTPEDAAGFHHAFHRLKAVYAGICGDAAEEALRRLGDTMLEALTPTLAGPDTVLSVQGAIDVVNDCLYQVGHEATLAGRAGAERWLPPVENVRASSAWILAADKQRVACCRKMAAVAAVAAATHKKTGTGGGGGRTKRPKPEGTPTKAAPPKQRKTTKQTPSEPAPVATVAQMDASTASDGERGDEQERCHRQDDPDGCPFGTECWFKHDRPSPQTKKRGGRRRKKRDE